MKKTFDRWAAGQLRVRARCRVESSMSCLPLSNDPICAACYESDAAATKQRQTQRRKTGARGQRRLMEGLYPTVAQMCALFVDLCKEQEVPIKLISTLRTEAEQLALFSQGRKSLKEVNGMRTDAGLAPITKEANRIVTHAPTSVHQFGCAFDICLLKDGKAVWDIKADINNNQLPDYHEAGKLGESVGLKWGGRFKLRDYVHFEHTGGLGIEELKAGKRPECKNAPQNKNTPSVGRETIAAKGGR